MKGEEQTSKETSGESCASVSHSRDADSEGPTIVPRRLVPVFEESTIVQLHDHQTSPTGENVHDGQHSAKKVRPKSYIEIEQIIHDVTVTSRYLSKTKSL